MVATGFQEPFRGEGMCLELTHDLILTDIV